MEDLCVRVGKGWKSISLNSNMDNKEVIQYLRGICESDLWGIVENINTLKLPLLSMISSYFQTIKTSLTLHLREFSLAGRITKMFPSVSFMCSETTTVGVQYLEKVPLSLKILLRKVSVQLPDMEKIICTLMRKEGLRFPQLMSKNLTESCNLVFKLLNVYPGSRIHLYKLLIGQVSQKLKDSPDNPENQLFYFILSKYFKHCLTKEDFQMAKNIFKTTFKIEKNVEEKMELSFERDNNNSLSDNLSFLQEEKVNHIIELLSVVNSVVVLGPQKSGKTFIINEVCKHFSKSIQQRKFYLNLDTYNAKEIYGNQFTDGVIPNLLNKSENPFILHLDGFLDDKNAMPLSLLIDKNEFYDGKGKHFTSKCQNKILLEACSLDSISETFLTRSPVVCISLEEDDMVTQVLKQGINQIFVKESSTTKESLILQSSKLVESFMKRNLSPIDQFLGRTITKKVQEFMKLLHIIFMEKPPCTITETLLFAFFTAFSSCETKKNKSEIISTLKQCVQNNKDIFEGATVLENLCEILPEGIVDVHIHQSLITTVVMLLQRKIPVLIIGEREAQEVFNEILSCYKLSNPASNVTSCKLHSLSTADMVVDNLKAHLQKRGQNELVPKGCKEILVAISDLSTPITDSNNKNILQNL